MGNHQLTSLIRMANQIAANNTHIGDEIAEAEMVANHMTKFWARTMKVEIKAYLQQDGSELLPIAQKAVSLLKD
ncbi:formate dehydrogenase subunit delta [Amphritea sp. 1_MG-2023]|uniref:formate dehydrogenase subunit delta n=1 Tax=Amphritea sp. 1_MG-2023 TaxID=3062670 RepID=UPI0026E265B2|nr:formate dehydrogenase subunit delta [Amphritea sp. 1_MG-2023]MDO6561950.1 formate dehydrogenase subunit delta [Amphritea sp. 1_MG-2023]